VSRSCRSCSRVTCSGIIDRLIRAVDPSPATRVLDVATGPGDVALGFAAQCREVVGIDLTSATLALAEAQRKERGRANLHFVMGDAEHLPFENDTFDVVVCRFAFHHGEEGRRSWTSYPRRDPGQASCGPCPWLSSYAPCPAAGRTSVLYSPARPARISDALRGPRCTL